jgi:hypothetical protein
MLNYSKYSADDLVINDPKLRAQSEKFIRSIRTPTDLKPSVQLALLTAARTELSKLVVAKLMRSTVRASAVDYLELERSNWAIRAAGRSFHSLTPGGRFKADALAKLFARELDIHFFMTRGARFQSSVACTCGWTYSHSRNEGHERSAFARRMGEHLESVGQTAASVVAGYLVPPQPATTTAQPSAFMLEPRGERT